jgi:hypothetical protein
MMEREDNILEFHSKISHKIYQTLDEISDGMDSGNITTRVAKKIIGKVQTFNYNREVLMEKHRSGQISARGMKIMEGKAGQQCIDEINRIMAEVCV